MGKAKYDFVVYPVFFVVSVVVIVFHLFLHLKWKKNPKEMELNLYFEFFHVNILSMYSHIKILNPKRDTNILRIIIPGERERSMMAETQLCLPCV